jgi:hypothetical protein
MSVSGFADQELVRRPRALSQIENWPRLASAADRVYFFGYVIFVVMIFPLKANGASSK